MIVELHMIQNFAPSCLNRDDTNSPKDCDFGGVRRARISSQCLKRSIRMSDTFKESIKVEVGVRTRMLYQELADHLKAGGKGESDINPILRAFIPSLVGAIDEDERTKVLLFLGKDEIIRIEQILDKNWDSLTGKNTPTSDNKTGAEPKKKGKKASESSPLEEICKTIVKEFKPGTISPDIALFGRMVADKHAFNVEAACQVAHAISTHRVNMDMDFFTAVDDLQPKDETGAGMMGTVEFDSACFYRYSALDVNELMKNLGGDRALTLRTLDGFLHGSIEAIPSGKQNSMAAHNLPSLLLVAVRAKGQPWSLANAFATPVTETGHGLVETSTLRLGRYTKDMFQMYGGSGIDMIGYAVIGSAQMADLESIGAKRFESVADLLGSIGRRTDELLGNKA
ncbi:MAG TPA: type I-E CRISPR-associated protein Cas7/Cse4/CasC [Methanomassiliicoccales archaeon]|jgi:CRISPR system Cascade subunit CasC